jgi:hypothetical protein
VNEISLTKSYNTLQVVHYTHLAKNYFEEFMLTNPNQVVHIVILHLYSTSRKWCLTGRSGLGVVVRAGQHRHCRGPEELGWAGRPVERAGHCRGPTGGAAKNGVRRHPRLVGHGPGEAKPSRAAADGIGGQPGMGHGEAGEAAQEYAVAGLATGDGGRQRQLEAKGCGGD